MKRREFLNLSLISAGALGLQFIPLPLMGSTSSNKKKVIVIFLRGASDVLSLFPPKPDNPKGWIDYKKHPLYPWRGKESEEIAKSFLFDTQINGKQTLKSFSIDGYSHNFHPNFQNIKYILENKNLAVFLNTGSINKTRSHFEQMDLIESGSSKRKLNSGYLSRASKQLTSRQQAIALGSLIPNSLNGSDVVLLGSKDDVGSNYLVKDKDKKTIKVDGTDLKRSDRLNLFKPSQIADQASGQYDTLERELANYQPSDQLNNEFILGCELAAKLTHAESSNPPLITLDSKGWDHHFNGIPTSIESGLTAKKIAELSKGLEILDKNSHEDTIVVVMSEFGRTIVANSDLGTDHGRGSAMIVMGKKVNHSKIKNTEPTKSWEFLNHTDPQAGLEGAGSSAALKVVTDYREIIGEVLEKHLGLNLASSTIPIFDTDFDPNSFRRRFRNGGITS